MLTDEQIEAAFAEAQSGAPYMGVCTKRQFADAIESAATAPLLEQLAERDKRIAELERKSDQDDETIAWQAQKISQHIDRITELEQQLAKPCRHDLQSEGKHPSPCAKFCEAQAFRITIRGLERELEQARQQMERQKDEWLSWEAKRKALESAAVELEAVRKDAERWRTFLNTRPASTHEVILQAIDDAAMKEQK